MFCYSFWKHCLQWTIYHPHDDDDDDGTISSTRAPVLNWLFLNKIMINISSSSSSSVAILFFILFFQSTHNSIQFMPFAGRSSLLPFYHTSHNNSIHIWSHIACHIGWNYAYFNIMHKCALKYHPFHSHRVLAWMMEKNFNRLRLALHKIESNHYNKKLSLE